VPVLGITGGIATGKTSFTQTAKAELDATVFDADACARDLVDRDLDIREALKERFGARIFGENGELDRGRLREIVFQDETERRALEFILHPKIRETWTRIAETANARKTWLLIDIPLLFETFAERFFDVIVVIACSRAVQMHRLIAIRKLTPQVAEEMVESQTPLSEKIQRADHVLWNDSSPLSFKNQMTVFHSYLTRRYG
jgi:dephospho-CoA kinase